VRRAFPAFVLTAALVSVVACVRPLPSAPEEDFDAAAQGPDAGGSTTGAAGQATNASGGGGHAAASVAAGGTGGTAGTAGSTGGTGGVVGSDAAVPTCSDGIKNSDETGVDCGGHCGKCAAGNGCLVDRDCQFACRSDKTCGACIVAADCPGIESECQHRTCTAGTCGMQREAAGVVLALQTTGDCKRRQCATDGTVIVFANDGSKWSEDSRFVRSARPDQQGQFQIKGLPAGEYLAVAADYVQEGMWNDPEYLEGLRRYAQRVALTDGEARSVTLKLTNVDTP